MSWVTISIGAGVGALGGGSYANSKGQDPVKGALLGATVGGLGGWAAAPAAPVGGASAITGSTVASGAAPLGTMPAYTGASAQAGASLAAPTAFETAAAGVGGGSGAGAGAGAGAFEGAVLSGNTVGSGATTMGTETAAAETLPTWTGSSAQPSFWSGLGKDVGKGVAINGTMQAGNAAFNPPPTVRTPGQPLTLQQPQQLQFQRLNFG